MSGFWRAGYWFPDFHDVDECDLARQRREQIERDNEGEQGAPVQEGGSNAAQAEVQDGAGRLKDAPTELRFDDIH